MKATTLGVKRFPSAFCITFGSPPSTTATTELVVPKSIPMIFSFFIVMFPFHIDLCSQGSRVWRPGDSITVAAPGAAPDTALTRHADACPVRWFCRSSARWWSEAEAHGKRDTLHSTAACLTSSGLDFDPPRFRRFRLRQMQRQHAVLEFRRDCVGVDRFGHRERAVEIAHAVLAADRLERWRFAASPWHGSVSSPFSKRMSRSSGKTPGRSPYSTNSSSVSWMSNRGL